LNGSSVSKFDPKRLIPRSLTGQVMLALAGALLLAQTIGAILLYKAQAGYREQQVTQELAMRTAIALRHRDDVDPSDGPLPRRPRPCRVRVSVRNITATIRP
jgi:hypothetical protein